MFTFPNKTKGTLFHERGQGKYNLLTNIDYPKATLWGLTLDGQNMSSLGLKWPKLAKCPRMLCDGNGAISHLQAEMGYVEDFCYNMCN